MKNIIFFYLIFTVTMLAQNENSFTFFDDKSGKECLIGVCDRAAFSDTVYSGWFDSEYEEYVVDTESTGTLKELLKDVKIKIIMATWCSDSRREVPRFYKIMDSMTLPADKITCINVNREKKGVADETDSLDIKFVPTFIFYKEGKELGRIVETPVQSLEKDMLGFFITAKEE